MKYFCLYFAIFSLIFFPTVSMAAPSAPGIPNAPGTLQSPGTPQSPGVQQTPGTNQAPTIGQAPGFNPPAGVCSGVSGTISQFKDIVCLLAKIIFELIPLVIGLTVLVFFWGLAKFILHAGDEEARKEGKSIMIWGTIGLFVAVSIWAIVSLIYNDFSFGTGGFGIPKLPVFN